MKKYIFIILLLYFQNSFTQNVIEKNYIVLIFKIEQNDDLHPGRISYWIADSEVINSNGEFKFLPFFLKLFYTSNSYDDCCLGKTSNFYSFNDKSEFEFAEGFEKKQEVFSDFLKSNSRKIQTIKKEWENGQKQTVTISAVPVKTKICSCKISDAKGYNFESVALPLSDFELDNEFWKNKKADYINTDYSNFDSEY